MIPRDCLGRGPGCTGVAYGGPRCRVCETAYQARRNASPKRQAYRDPEYRKQPKGGTCWICGREGAETRDHVIPLAVQMDRWNEVRDHRTRPAHRSCNSARGEKVQSDFAP